MFSPQDVVLADELIESFWHSLSAQRTSAVEAVFIPDEAFRHYKADFVPEIVASLESDSITAFSTDAILRNLQTIIDSAGAYPNAADISVVLNRFGLTSVRIALPESLAPTRTAWPEQSPPARPWDSYIAHTSANFRLFPDSFSIHFARQLMHEGPSSILIDASDLPHQLNGTSRLAIEFLRYLNQEVNAGRLNWNVTVLAPEAALDRYAPDLKSLQHIGSLSEGAQQYDLGVSITPVTNLSRCVDLVRRCVRWVVLQLDIIAIRSIPHLSQHLGAKPALEFINSYADLVVSISDATRADVTSYLSTPISAPQVVCHLGVPDSFTAIQTNPTEPDSPFVLVLGNDEPHKRTRPTVQALTDAGYQVVSISSSPPINSAHQTITPGTLSDKALKQLIAQSTAVVFPSEYEGFGLPLVEVAATGRAVVAWKTAVNEELVESLELQNVHLVSSNDMLVSAVRLTAGTLLQTAPHLRRMSTFHQEFVSHLNNVLESRLVMQQLTTRWRVTRLMHASADEAKRATLTQLVESGQTSLKRILLDRIRAKLKLGHESQ